MRPLLGEAQAVTACWPLKGGGCPNPIRASGIASSYRMVSAILPLEAFTENRTPGFAPALFKGS